MSRAYQDFCEARDAWAAQANAALVCLGGPGTPGLTPDEADELLERGLDPRRAAAAVVYPTPTDRRPAA